MTYPEYLIDKIKNRISASVAQALNVPQDAVLACVESPKSEAHGDFCIPIPQLKIKGKNPAAIAAELASTIVRDDIVANVHAIGPFLNFTVHADFVLVGGMQEIWALGDAYGRNDSGAGKTVIVEFSSPNIAKPFHAGHLRSTIIGNFMRLSFIANGYKTIGMNYLGDWGKQYGLLAIGFNKYGSEEALAKNPIRHLFDVYVKINADADADETIHEAARNYFVRMEAGDEEVLGLWRRFRDVSIDEYKKLYEKLGVHFDVYSGESHYETAMKKYATELEQLGLAKESKGAQIIDLNEHADKLGVVLLYKTDGASTYIMRDIAAANERHKEFAFDKMYYVVASQQDLHLQQLFKIIGLMERPWASSLEHINYGLVTGMSTRKGTVKFLEDIIEDTKEVMHEVMRKNDEKYAQVENPEETSLTLAISAIMIQDMSARRIKNYAFDAERMTSFEGDTGPYLQYAHCRLSSVERKNNLVVASVDDIDCSLLTEETARDLVLKLVKYPEVVRDCIRTNEPCTLVTYLMTLSHTISSACDSLWVKGQPEPLAKARLGLFVAARQVLGNGLRLLGIKPLTRM